MDWLKTIIFYMDSKMVSKWVFIVNPISGNGFGITMAPVIRKMADKYNIEAEVVITEYKDHAMKLAGEYASKGFRYIIGVGGDGTMNQVSRALLNRDNIITGIIPAGTGNDFIRILGFPGRFSEREWEIFFRAEIAEIDVGICNGMPFINGMGLGFDARVVTENYTGSGEVKQGGKSRYVLYILKTLLLHRERKMTIIDGDVRTDTDCLMHTIAVGRRFAIYFYLTPEAIANDGLLDVCMIRRLNLIRKFGMLLKVLTGRHIHDSRVNYYKTDNIELEFDEKVPCHLDGELFFSDKFRVKCIPGALKIIYNPSGKHFFDNR
ncbi:MAG TPA: diacylglycerol kinase family protein [Bacteroidales bacterium]|nr:diacylglycerol kinase family protein [Bacteroidales bacterium]